MTNGEVELLCDMSKLIDPHQQCFDSLHQLSQVYLQQDEPKQGDRDANPSLFLEVENIMDQVFAAWREKYDLMNKKAGVEGFSKYHPLKFGLDDQLYAILEKYDIYDGEIPVLPLRIYHPTSAALSYPELLESYSHFWRERHTLEIQHLAGKVVKLLSFKIDETAGSEQSPSEKMDRLNLSCSETIEHASRKMHQQSCCEIKRSFSLSINRLAVGSLPHPHRIPNHIFHQPWK